MKKSRLVSFILAVVGCLTLLSPAPVAAHPLGNFTVNRYARLEVKPERMRVRYVLDMAEIPTFQAMAQLDANGDGTVAEAEGRAYAERQLSEVSRGVQLTVAGTRVPLRSAEAGLEMVPGQAGLSTTRISGWLEPVAAPRIADGARIELRDENEPARVGWREMVVRAEGVSLSGAFPTREVSDELRGYPEDMLMGPLDVRRVSLDVVSASVSALGVEVSAGPSPLAREISSSGRTGLSLERATERLAEPVTSVTLTPGIVLGALLTAMVLGAGHALSPGHGKTIVGAYLVGTRGTARHALFLGLTVTVVHTAGVFALLLVTLFASRYVLPEALFPWMSLASGLLVVAIGVGLVRGRWRSARGNSHHHADAHGELAHDHGMGAHTHAMPRTDGQRVTWRSLLALGVSGGLLPCPSALVLGLASIAIGRALYGLVLIVAFSAGLAATLVAIGLMMVYSGRAAGRLRLMERMAGTRGAAWMRQTWLLPVGSALVVTAAGLALSAEALRQLDLAALWVGSAVMVEAGSLALLGTALTLGLRHGIDWDHIAAIGDITSSAPAAADRRGGINVRDVGLAGLYAIGHALVVVALGMAALTFGALLPEWVDPIMERLVGVTLLLLGFWVVYSLVRVLRGGPEVRLQSRWMLVFAGVRRAWGAIQARLHGHVHTGAAHVHRVDRYGAKTAFGTGLIHGIGAETGTQVLLIAAVGGAATQGLGVGMLLAFVAGLLVSNTAVAVLTSVGFVSVGRARTVYLGVACLTAIFSLWVGSYAVLGISDQLPDIQRPIVALLGEATAD